MSPSQNTKRPQTDGRLEVVSLYKGNQHYGSTGKLLQFTLSLLTAPGAKIWEVGQVAAGRNTTQAWGLPSTQLGAPEGQTHRHYTTTAPHSDRKEMQGGN